LPDLDLRRHDGRLRRSRLTSLACSTGLKPVPKRLKPGLRLRSSTSLRVRFVPPDLPHFGSDHQLSRSGRPPGLRIPSRLQLRKVRCPWSHQIRCSGTSKGRSEV
jgi:hypothetical protein